MDNKTTTRVPLVFAFIVAFFGTLFVMTMSQSESGLGVITYFPYFLLGILGYTVQNRLKEKGEKPTPGTVIMAVILLMIPLLNLFILGDLLSNKKKSPHREYEEVVESEK